MKNTAEIVGIAELPEAIEVKDGEVIDALPVGETGESEAAVTEVFANPAEINKTADALSVPSSLPEPQPEKVSIPVLHFPTRSILSLFPDAPRTQLYATVIGGALIILMFEVVIR